MTRHLCLLLTLLPLTVAASRADAEPTLLNFDDAKAPCTFAEAGPLDTQYASAGVIFSGGMEVLSECGNFGIVEHSNKGFLAWNSSSEGNGPPATLTFTRPVSNFSFLTGSAEQGTVTATAYDGAGGVLATQTITLVNSAIPIVLEVHGITKVVITSTALYGAIDDLRFER